MLQKKAGPQTDIKSVPELDGKTDTCTERNPDGDDTDTCKNGLGLCDMVGNVAEWVRVNTRLLRVCMIMCMITLILI